ncbi:DNA internalization-related competence protein ComEC/Rec2 [Entomomonas asaccharolytica]|uniref:DNA internalization-related competence protein ComEC/Rec2 n=1 Tax=Entomomonas asaccharolytica TaxID=2785331 RepID=A0A974NEP6_9GAMM|nr:DNA internalization-related competence protein ComEC/Rec2 [Entomomonas asaccharolytica]QQP85134.1 DNA internalization-related competence protein ComEC/Rec2 [Entomomonas asaccharolytica]
MQIALIAFIIGLLSIRFFPVLPSISVCIFLACVGLTLLPWRLYPLGMLLTGIAWGCYGAIQTIDDRLNPALDGETLWMEGTVVGLPEQSEQVVRFQLKNAKAKGIQLPTNIRLTWYKGEQVATGEYWRLQVRLKYPRGTVNPYVFDYEAWLTAKHIGATGTVKQAYRLQESSTIINWRYQLRQKILAQLNANQTAGLIALVLGDGSVLSRSQWQVLQETGTVHLMVISGQHITLLAGFLYFFIAALVRLGWWPKRLPWLPIACGLAMLGALAYGLLAGFEVPVQRACIMLALVLLWRLRFRYLGVTIPFLMALAIVLTADPLASLQAGFWLSFSAVAILLLLLSGRLSHNNWWLSAIKIQWAITIGLIPVLLVLLLPVSLTSPIANLIAIPLVSFIIVPCALLGTLFINIPYVGAVFLWLAGSTLKLLFIILTFIAEVVPAWVAPMPAWWAFVLAFLGVVLILLPKGALLRVFGIVFCLPLFFANTNTIKENQAEVNVFDVGQGLSVLVRTKNHSLLYDTGPSFGDFNLGGRVIVPSLQRQGVRSLDKVIISHVDTDHAGGLEAISKRLAIQVLISGEPNKLTSELMIKPCQNSSWQWDGVRFSLWQWSTAKNGNDASCVLLVEANGEKLLLTGDISRKAEQAWLTENNKQVNWLLAPHHGSKNSSSWNFLASIKPQYIIVSRGWLNPFGHPSLASLERYQKIGARVEDTALTGALQIHLGAFQSAIRQRDTKYFWRKQ